MIERKTPDQVVTSGVRGIFIYRLDFLSFEDEDLEDLLLLPDFDEDDLLPEELFFSEEDFELLLLPEDFDDLLLLPEDFDDLLPDDFESEDFAFLSSPLDDEPLLL